MNADAFHLLCSIHKKNFDNSIAYSQEIRTILEEYSCLTDGNLPKWFLDMLLAVSKSEVASLEINYEGATKASNAASIPIEMKNRLGWEVVEDEEGFRLRFPHSQMEVLIQYEGDKCKIRRKHGDDWATWEDWKY